MRGAVPPSKSTQLASLIITGAAWASVFVQPIVAAAQDDPSAPRTADLQAIEQDLQREQTVKDDATRMAERAAADTAKVQNDMVEAARRIQDRERALTDLEAQLSHLEDQRAEMASALVNKDAQMREALLALERLALRPTDALLLQPLRPADAIRSGLVLSAAIPALTENAARLQIELEALYTTRTKIVGRRSTFALETLSLIEDQARLEKLHAEKASMQKGFERQATDSEERIAALAREANDLRELLDSVIAERKRRGEEEAKRVARAAPILTQPDEATPTPDIVAARRPTPPAPARSFSKARGTLPFPAEGRLSQRYGEGTESEVLAKGIVITTRTAAHVVSPFDGVVAFAGPFRGYGQLLILEHSEGYHTLLAGMSRLDGAVGQRVLAGEPVGVMSPDGDPSLYVELRRDGQPINPLPWLATRTNEKSG
ncbi:MAG: peptidoglycan DD-metalloendopeptidase family protein [Rhodospirillaceae bacterium]|nr:peptidoglycan DD-metalloendopeptidase family protein [Rhodospirillaceae bacterium]